MKKALVVIGNEGVIENIRRHQESDVTIASSDDECVVAIYTGDIPDISSYGLDRSNPIKPETCLPFLSCKEYHAAIDDGSGKIIFIEAELDLSEDADNRIITIVEWARALFRNLRWDDGHIASLT